MPRQEKKNPDIDKRKQNLGAVSSRYKTNTRLQRQKTDIRVHIFNTNIKS